MDTLAWVLAGVFSGGILHILCVLGVPWLAEKDAWSRLAAAMPLNAMAVEDRRSVVLPFTSPDAVHAYCIFDISDRNVVVTSPLADPAWSIALATRSGENFYVITGADAKKNNLRVLIIPRDRLAQEESTEKTAEGDEQNIIVSPSSTGIVAIQAPLRGESFRPRTEKMLGEARCETQQPVTPPLAAMPEPQLPEAVTAAREPPQRLRRSGRRRRR